MTAAPSVPVVQVCPRGPVSQSTDPAGRGARRRRAPDAPRCPSLIVAGCASLPAVRSTETHSNAVRESARSIMLRLRRSERPQDAKPGRQWECRAAGRSWPDRAVIVNDGPCGVHFHTPTRSMSLARSSNRANASGCSMSRPARFASAARRNNRPSRSVAQHPRPSSARRPGTEPRDSKRRWPSHPAGPESDTPPRGPH